MKYFYNKNLTTNARSLRKDMTPWERKLWHLFLKNFPIRIYRQRVIGSCIVDFYCPKAKLAIELDGSQHFTSEGLDSDRRRDATIEALGIDIFRIPNIDIDCRFQSVCDTIDREIRSRLQ